MKSLIKNRTFQLTVFALLGLLSFAIINPMFTKIRVKKANEMLEDKAKVYNEAKKYQVNFENNLKITEIDGIIFKNWLNVMKKDGAKHILFRFSMLESIGIQPTFNDLTYSIEGIDENKETVDYQNKLYPTLFDKNHKIIIKNGYSSYQMAHKRLNINKINGFRNSNIDGVKFDIDAAIEWVGKSQNDKYYFYTAIDEKLIGKNLHTIIISTDPNAYVNTEIRTEYSYGDKGTGCCQ